MSHADFYYNDGPSSSEEEEEEDGDSDSSSSPSSSSTTSSGGEGEEDLYVEEGASSASPARASAAASSAATAAARGRGNGGGNFREARTPSGYSDAYASYDGGYESGDEESDSSAFSSSSAPGTPAARSVTNAQKSADDDNNNGKNSEGTESAGDAQQLRRGMKQYAADRQPVALRSVMVSAERTHESVRSFWPDGSRNWNNDFQRILELPFAEPRKWRLLRELANEFVSTAKTLGKIIISEQGLPDAHKTIKPASMGGIAGGDKFNASGIIFKFARDVELTEGLWMYGGSERDDGLAVPLMALIDYCGFRLVCVSRIPIGRHSLVYGSADAGLTVKASSQRFNELMDQAGSRLNLAKHTVGSEQICGPADIEGHIGDDGRRYLLDFARFAPAESPVGNPFLRNDRRSIFYRCLRPEWVRKSPAPLSSDAFTRFGRLSDADGNRPEAEAEMHNERVSSWTKELIGNETRACAEVLAQDADAADKLVGSSFNSYLPTAFTAPSTSILRSKRVVELIHRQGLNLRHMGLVFNHILDISAASSAAPSVFVEMIARALKQELRAAMRTTVEREGLLAQMSQKELVADYLNVLLGRDIRSSRFWTMDVRDLVEKKFFGIEIPALSTDESIFGAWMSYRFPLKEHIPLLIARFAELSGFEVSKRIDPTIYETCHIPRVFATDIKLKTRVKYSGIIDLAQGMVLGHQALDVSLTEQQILLAEACNRLESAVGSMPSDFSLLAMWGEMILRQLEMSILADPLESRDKLGHSLALAREKLQMSLEKNPNYVPALRSGAVAEAFHGNVDISVARFRELLVIAEPAFAEDFSLDENMYANRPFEFTESALAAKDAWMSLVDDLEKWAFDGYRGESILPVAHSMAVACGAVGGGSLEDSFASLGTRDLLYEAQSSNISSEFTSQFTSHASAVGIDVQVRVLTLAVKCAWKLLSETDNFQTKFAWPDISNPEEKDARLRGFIEVLLRLKPHVLDDVLRDIADLEEKDPRIYPPSRAYLFYLCGVAPLDEKGERARKPLAPRLLERVELILIPHLSGSCFQMWDFITTNSLSTKLSRKSNDVHELAWATIAYFLPKILASVQNAFLQSSQDITADQWLGVAREFRAQGHAPVKLQTLEIKSGACGKGALAALKQIIQGANKLAVRSPPPDFDADSFSSALRMCGETLESIEFEGLRKSIVFSDSTLWQELERIQDRQGHPGFSVTLPSGYSDASWAEIAATTQVRLRRLDVSRSSKSSTWLAALSKQNMASLTSLRVHTLDSAALQALSSAKPELSSFSFAALSGDVDASASSAFFSGPGNQIESLEFREWQERPQYDHFLEALFSSGALAHLQHVIFPRSTRASCPLVIGVLKRAKALKKLRLSGLFDQHEDLCAAIACVSSSTALQELTIDSVYSRTGPCEICAANLASLHLRVISLFTQNLVDEAFLRELISQRTAGSIEELVLAVDQNSGTFTRSTAKALLSQTTSLRCLDVSRSAFGDETVLASVVQGPSLQKLTLNIDFQTDELFDLISQNRKDLLVELGRNQMWHQSRWVSLNAILRFRKRMCRSMASRFGSSLMRDLFLGYVARSRKDAGAASQKNS